MYFAQPVPYSDAELNPTSESAVRVAVPNFVILYHSIKHTPIILCLFDNMTLTTACSSSLSLSNQVATHATSSPQSTTPASPPNHSRYTMTGVQPPTRSIFPPFPPNVPVDPSLFLLLYFCFLLFFFPLSIRWNEESWQIHETFCIRPSACPPCQCVVSHVWPCYFPCFLCFQCIRSCSFLIFSFQSSLPVIAPTRISPRPNERDTVIDLALCNQFNLVQQFDVNDYDLLVSDHRPLHAQLHTTSAQPNAHPHRPIWRTSRANINWELFQSSLTQHLSLWKEKSSPYMAHDITFAQHSIDMCWYELRHAIIQVAMSVIGKKPVSGYHKHWFTIDPDIPSLHKKYVVLKQWYIYKKRDSPMLPIIRRDYLHARQQFRTAMRNAKQACWHEL